MEQERDASAILTDLDKGLRSANPAEQCEVVVRFPRLFEKYPFPILINSAFLKLADVYRNGTNFLRLCILQVVENSEKHLEKIINLDEFVRRIYTAVHSNDPVARAVTLKILGLCAHITAENKQIHHCIKVGLVSHDAVEVKAAIFAVDRFTGVSVGFALSVWDKLLDMMTTTPTSAEMKLCLVPVLRHMHRDTTVLKNVQSICTDLLKNHPSVHLTTVVLKTLTTLATSAVLIINSQITLLLKYLQYDDRVTVQFVSLKCLLSLAKISPHLWEAENINALCQFVLEKNNIKLQLAGLQILTVLSTKRANNVNDSTMKSMLTCSRRFSYNTNMKLSLCAVKLYVSLAANKIQLEKEVVDEASAAIENFIKTSVNENNVSLFKIGVRCAINLCLAHTFLINHLVPAFLKYISTITNEEMCEIMCEGLLALSDKRQIEMNSYISILCEKLCLLENNVAFSRKFIEKLTTLILQSHSGEIISQTTELAIQRVLQNQSAWLSYCIGRQSIRYGHYAFAEIIFENLKLEVASESFYFWLCSLKHCCEAEKLFMKHHLQPMELSKQLLLAYRLHLKTSCALDAASNPSYPLHFHAKLIQCRLQMLNSLRQLSCICNDYCMLPPPATQSQSTCVHLLSQLNTCLSSLHALNMAHCSLYESCFDADDQSLNFLTLCEKIYQFLTSVVNNLLGLCKSQKVMFCEIAGTVSNKKELLTWRRAFTEINKLTKVINTNAQLIGLTSQHVHYVRQVISVLCSVPLCLPRFFFQRRFNTDIKLAVLPQPTPSSDAVFVSKDLKLAVKVEGVIQYDNNHFRKIKQVKVAVQSEVKVRSLLQESDEKLARENAPITMEQNVTPHNDYFVSEFLLQFGVVGLHQLTVTAYLIDGSGCLWTVGQPVRVAVKSHEDKIHHQSQQGHLQSSSTL